MGLHYQFWELFMNPFFWSGLMGWLVAQTIKMTYGALHTHSFDFTYLLSTGGMPSAHSSLVMGLFVSIGMEVGFGHPICVLASVFATVTMFDAATVRRAAGLQARLLNTITRQLFSGKSLAKPLKEMLGHTRLEVFGGMWTGTIVGVIITWLFNAYHIFGWKV